MSPEGVTKVINAKHNSDSIDMVILIGEDRVFLGLDNSWPKMYVCMTVPWTWT